MGQLVLHIGLPKAASTSLQESLAAIRPQLADHGIAYPHTGRPDHHAEAAWFVTKHEAYGANTSPYVAATIQQLATSADWDSLRHSVHDWPTTIVSSERFSRFGPTMAAAALASLTNGHADLARVVIIVRPVSRLLPSLFAQTAMDFPLPSFEAWARLQLRGLLLASTTANNTRNHHLDADGLVATWREVAPVRVVHFDSPTGSDFEADLLDSLMLSEVLSAPFLGHSNRSLCAARILAWQRCLTRAGRPDRPGYLGKPLPFLAFDDSMLPGGGGRFELSPEAAVIVDAAFPRPTRTGQVLHTDASEAARSTLGQLIVSAEPLTLVAGVDQDGLSAGIALCMRHLPFADGVL